LDYFLDGNFLSYGVDVVKFALSEDDWRSDPMMKIFPRLTKCTFSKYGKSGTIEYDDALCVLALNILNEKIFIFLWFWFAFLAIAAAIALIYTMIIIMSPTMRKVLLTSKFRPEIRNNYWPIIRKTEVRKWSFIRAMSTNSLICPDIALILLKICSFMKIR